LKNGNDLKEESSQMLITLGKWLNCENNIPDKTRIKSSIYKFNVLLNFSNEHLSKTNQLMYEVIYIFIYILYANNFFQCIFNCTHFTKSNLTISDFDEQTLMIGQLLRISVSFYSSLANVWNELSCWCYKLGRRVMDEAYK